MAKQEAAAALKAAAGSTDFVSNARFVETFRRSVARGDLNYVQAALEAAKAAGTQNQLLKGPGSSIVQAWTTHLCLSCC